jgi:hypothetical protein
LNESNEQIMNDHFFNNGTDTISGRIDRIARMKVND